MEAWRCNKCNRLLARLKLAPGSVVEIKCGMCNHMNTVSQPVIDKPRSVK